MNRSSQPNIYQLLSHFRHDLLNDLQLLLGHLQLGRSQEVIYQDSSKMVARIQAVSSLYACGDDELATQIWHWQLCAEENLISFSQQIEPLHEPPAKKNLLALERLVSSLLVEIALLDDSRRFLHINISSGHPQFLLKSPPLADDSPIILVAQQEGWRLERATGDWRYWNVH